MFALKLGDAFFDSLKVLFMRILSRWDWSIMNKVSTSYLSYNILYTFVKLFDIYLEVLVIWNSFFEAEICPNYNLFFFHTLHQTHFTNKLLDWYI